MNSNQVLVSVLALAALTGLAGTATATVRVGGSAFSANGQLARDHQYSGSCPVDLKFDWGVISTSSTTVAYSITRSDGGSTRSRFVDVPAGRSVPVLENWHLGANTPQFATYSGWVDLVIESPNPVTNRIRFTIHCGGYAASVRVGGSAFSVNGQLARDHQYTGACPVELTFDWGVIGTDATPVTYSFNRSDGGHSSNAMTIDLPQANRSVPILDHWRLGANTPQFADYRGWVELSIESPNPVANRIGFTLHCM